ncbi:MAG TPA: ABC transporter ATP-binding protein [Acidimicrobiia bacterium]
MSGLDASIVLRRSDDFVVDIRISIPSGTTVALLGPNGAGKSTVVQALAGIQPLDDGTITLNGLALDDASNGVFVPPEKRNIGVVFQDYLLFPHLSVSANIEFGWRSRGLSAAEARKQCKDWIGRLELAGLEDRRPAELSGGEQQRVALARALAFQPDLLLLDEPLSALDVTTRNSLRTTLAGHLVAFPGPRLLITHDPAEAFHLADEIYVIENGSITQIGTADDIRLRPKTRYASDLAGSNLLHGVAGNGRVRVGAHTLVIADLALTGDVLVNLRPASVSVHRSPPEGSPRNTWQTRVDRIELMGERARLLTGEPLALTVEITRAAVEALTLHTGEEVWLSVKATEIHAEPIPTGVA